MMTADFQDVRDAVAKMTPGLKADPYGTPGRYTQAANGEVIIRTEHARDQAAFIVFQNRVPALLADRDALAAEVERLRAALKPFADAHKAVEATIHLSGGVMPRQNTELFVGGSMIYWRDYANAAAALETAR